MSHFKAKINKIRFQLGLRQTPWKSLRRSPRSPSCIKGAYFEGGKQAVGNKRPKYKTQNYRHLSKSYLYALQCIRVVYFCISVTLLTYNDITTEPLECREERKGKRGNGRARWKQGGYIFYAGGSLAGAGYCRQCRRRPVILSLQLWQGCQVCVKISAQRLPRVAQFNAC